MVSLSLSLDLQVTSPMEELPHPLSSQRKKSSSGSGTSSGGPGGGGGGGGVKTQLSKLKEEQDADSDSPIGGYHKFALYDHSVNQNFKGMQFSVYEIFFKLTKILCL